MKQHLSLFLFSLLISQFSLSYAKPVDVATAQRVAEVLLKKAVVDSTPVSYTECYLFAGADGKGFALIAADDCVRPILGYSLTGTFPTEGLPDHIADWINAYQLNIAALKEAGAGSVSQEWEDMRRGKFATERDTAVGPLMTTTWSQLPYYNDQCPSGCVTGCVATAMAQVMKYWNHPAVGRGSHSYTPNGFETQSANFDTIHFDWAHMPNELNWMSSDTEVFAVAQLMHDVGIAIEMNYGPTSNAMLHSKGNPNQPSAENALKSYFRYNSGLFSVLRDEYTDAQWDSMLTADLNASRPIPYAGNDNEAGHAFVIDGYDYLGLYHVNWGWGGYCDGYYTFDNLSPDGSGVGGNPSNAYNKMNWALFHVYPVTEDSLVTVSVVSADTLKGTVTGGGTFPAYTSTSIAATAVPGYRFLSWGCGNRYNPYVFSPNNDFTDTALFVPVFGDTVGYCNSGVIELWGEYAATSYTEWGIRLPASAFREHRQLNALQIYGEEGATYTYNVYRGESCDRLVASGTYYTPDFFWYTVPLTRPVPLTGDDPVWITLTSNSYSNPATASCYTGNPEGTWYKRNGVTWEHLEDRGLYYSWMIRAVAGPLDPVDIVALAANPEEGSVTGGGSYYPGDTAVLTATPAAGYTFIGWSTGDMDNPLYLRVTSDATIYASFRAQTGIDEVNPDDHPAETATLYDINGRQLFTLHSPLTTLHSSLSTLHSPLSTSHSPFSTLHLPAGVYLLRQGASVKKIVIP